MVVFMVFLRTFSFLMCLCIPAVGLCLGENDDLTRLTKTTTPSMSKPPSATLFERTYTIAAWPARKISSALNSLIDWLDNWANSLAEEAFAWDTSEHAGSIPKPADTRQLS